MRNGPPAPVTGFMAAVGQVGWQSEPGPISGTTACRTDSRSPLSSGTRRPQLSESCLCLHLPTLRDGAISAFYDGVQPAQLHLPTLHFGDGTAANIVEHVPTAVAVSRVGVAGDGFDPLCSGGSRVRVSIGKTGQLACRRALAQRLGCDYESLGMQAVQYDLAKAADCAAFLRDARAAVHASPPMAFILKPAIGSFGRSIHYVPPSEAYARAEPLCQRSAASAPTLAMRYVEPLLLRGHKVDARSYLLIARTRPALVFWHRGFARRADVAFNRSDASPAIHVTNVGHVRAPGSTPDAPD